jgi:hypothetical protein
MSVHLVELKLMTIRFKALGLCGAVSTIIYSRLQAKSTDKQNVCPYNRVQFVQITNDYGLTLVTALYHITFTSSCCKFYAYQSLCVLEF